MEIVITCIIGAIAGWLGSKIFSGGSLGLLGNIVIGILGGVLGYWLLGRLGITLGSGIIGAILTGAIGALVILFVLNLVLGRKA